MSEPVSRTYLFVPATSPERFAKACAAGADEVIVDLEDAVPEHRKVAARAAVATWLSLEHPVLVRINAATTEWFERDLALCCMPGVSGIVLPKAEDVGDIQMLVLRGAPKVLPLIESAEAFRNLQDIADADKVQRLLFGSIDFKLDVGIDGDDEELLYFRSRLVLASRLARIQPPADGVSTAIDDVEQLKRDTTRARRLGFGAKLCIHPRQLVSVKDCFRPSARDIAWARHILQAVARADGAAVAVDGKMVDRPVILKAEQILREAQQSD